MKGKTKQRNKVRLLRTLALLALVTSLGVSGTLDKYSTTLSSTVSMRVAAFAGGGSFRFDAALESMSPGDRQNLAFQVTNTSEGQICEVGLEYEIRVETTGNLPLQFTLTGEKQESGEDSVLAAYESETGIAAGGFLPPGVSRSHNYTLTVTWDPAQTGEQYSYEIDMVTVQVTATQKDPTSVF